MVVLEKELPRLNGDLVFGSFIACWTGTMYFATQAKEVTLYDFERRRLQWLDGELWLNQEKLGLWLQDNVWIPIIASIVYFIMLRELEPYMKNKERPTWLKPVTMVWNALLAILSSFAAWRICATFRPMTTGQIKKMICTRQSVAPVTSLYVFWFCMSKIPELVDTFFLIMGKKKIKFLHWFHHVTVMWYCWMAISNMAWMGSLFAIMNLTVHSIMYTWYALAAADKYIAVGLKPGRVLSQIVTVLQILQMMIGTSLSLYVALKPGCDNHYIPVRFGIGMYFAYFVLFVQFFMNAYCRK